MTTTLAVQLRHNEFSSDLLVTAVSDILAGTEIADIATIRQGESYIHTAYFVYSDTLDLYFTSQPTDLHIANIATNPSAAAAIWCPTEKWGENLCGLQVFGTCEAVPLIGLEAAGAMLQFIQRFPAFQSIVKHPGEFVAGVTSRLYVLRPRRLKMIHEPILGRRKYVTVDL